MSAEEDRIRRQKKFKLKDKRHPSKSGDGHHKMMPYRHSTKNKIDIHHINEIIDYEDGILDDGEE